MSVLNMLILRLFNCKGSKKDGHCTEIDTVLDLFIIFVVMPVSL